MIIIVIIIITDDVYIDLRKSLINIFISIIVIDNIIITIDLCLKHIMLNKVIIYEKFEVVNSLTQLFNEYENLFID